MPLSGLARRSIGGLTALGLTLLLTGCMFSPGKFASELDLRKDGQFTFHYQGEIYVLALNDLTTKGGAKSEFTPSSCHDLDEDGNEVSRDCRPEEIESEKADWQTEQVRAEDKRKHDADQMRSVMGGFDPSDPKAADELAQRMRKQAGFRAVEYKGDGLYVIDFAVTSRLTHDFSFPTLERFPMANAFVQIALRQGGVVRVDAPGYASGGGGGNPMQAMLAGLGSETGGEGAPKLPTLDGRFTLTTDGEITANNTEEGPQAVPGGKSLSWTINSRTQVAPMALINLAK